MLKRFLRWIFQRSEDTERLEHERAVAAKRASREIVIVIMDAQVERARGNPERLAKMEAARSMTLEHWAAEDRAAEDRAHSQC